MRSNGNRWLKYMRLSTEKLRKLLTGPGHISEADFEATVKEAKKKDRPLERLLVEKGLVSDENLGRTIADSFDYHFVDLKKVKITDDLLDLIPEVVARSQQAIAFERTSDTILKVAMSNPDNFEFIKLLERKSGCRIEISYATPLGIEEALRYYKSDLTERVSHYLAELKANPRSEENIVRLVDLFLEYAHDNRASDIHMEPLGDTIAIRFRIDGVLHEVASYPAELHQQIVFRVKIMARLRTDEHAAAQDGRFDFEVGGAQFDVRVSILPVTDGENVVLRLLAERSRRLTLEDLGLVGHDLEKVRRAAEKPYGMLLAVGPTGCGKTTTLYAILQILNRPEVNITTIEDPVEYDVEHVQQTQVNPKKNLTFATGLRSIVRQDPDIIMVGEIRDNETAGIAINAAMTGHLLLSTLHANDAATTFPRLVDMGVEPFLVASSVNVVVAQRLVRKICQVCRVSYRTSSEELTILKAEPKLSKIVEQVFQKKDLAKITLYKGAGCKLCGNTGYRGRTGIFEVMEIGEELRSLIIEKTSSGVIQEKAQELQMTLMLVDGITKMSQGITTLEEVMRATKT